MRAWRRALLRLNAQVFQLGFQIAKASAKVSLRPRPQARSATIASAIIKVAGHWLFSMRCKISVSGAPVCMACISACVGVSHALVLAIALRSRFSVK